MAIINGNGTDEILTGTAGADTIQGFGGADQIDGLGGVDTATYAGSATGVNVSLTTGEGHGGDAEGDTLTNIENLTGSAFDDTLEGSSGTNVLIGGAGTDTVSYANAAAGVIVNLAVTKAQNTVGAGTDTLSSFENIIGSNFNDTLVGTSGANVIDGGGGIDTVSYAGSKAGVNISLAAGTATGGDATGDTLTNIENLTGSALADTLEGDDNDNVLNGGAGIDTVSYEHATAGVTVNLALVTKQNTVGAGSDTLVAFENVTGSAFDDTLTGNAAANLLIGLGGADTIDGGAGVDTVSYAASNAGVIIGLDGLLPGVGGDAAGDILTNIENITGSDFDDLITGNKGTNVLAGGAGDDTVSYANATAGVTVNLALTTAQNTVGAGIDTLSGFENIIGSNFNDTLTGTSGANTIDGGGGIDTVSYAASKAGVDISLAAGTATGGDATGDTLTSIENLIGSSLADTLEGDNGNNILNGGAGIDTVSYEHATAGVTVNLALTTKQDTGGAGQDTLAAFENLTGSDFDDTLTGSSVANVLVGRDGNDTLNGGAGADTMQGGAGDDTYIVDNAGDVVDETGGDGTDEVKSSVTFSLSDPVHAKGDIENLTLTGAAAINGTGNALDNTIVGNNAANIIAGLGGADTIDGGGGVDTASYAASAAGVTIKLDGSVGAGGDATGDTLTNIENITGSAFDDTLEGSSGNNVLIGGLGTDTVSYANATVGVTVNLAVTKAQNTVGAGTDTLSGFENITGSNFNDTLVGTTGANAIDGGGGTDTVSYAASKAGVAISLEDGTATGGDATGDTLTSIENLIGSNLADTIEGDGNNNVLNGGAGVDTVSYEHAAAAVTVSLAVTIQQDTVGAGLDTLVAFENLTGSGFDDTLTGNAAANVLAGLGGADAIDGGAGIDTASYAASAAGVTIGLDGSAGTGGDAAGDTLTNIENITGSDFDDVIAGNKGNNILVGGAGDDTVSYAGVTGTGVGGLTGVTVNLALTTAQNTVSAGIDTLSGFENVIGSDFNDTLTGTNGANAIDGGAGTDTVSYAASKAAVDVSLAAGTASGGDAAGDTLTNIENLVGSSFADTLEGDGGDNVLNGGAGIDTVSYEHAAAAVTVSLALATKQDTVGAGSDTLVAFENLTGSSFDDTLKGNAAANVLIGLGGADAIDGGAGVDTVSYAASAAGVDIRLDGSAGVGGDAAGDTLLGIENITGSDFDDTIQGAKGANVLIGGAGNDTVSYANATVGVTVDLSRTTAQNTVGAGTDTLSGFENIIGSDFKDTLTGTIGDNAIDGGAGVDTVSYANATSGVTVDLSLTTAQATGGAGNDTLTNIENLVGSKFDDTIAGNDGDNVLNGGLGVDTLTYANATAGVTISLALATAQNTGGAGTDTVSAFENLIGSDFDDTLEGEKGANVLDGGAGNNTVSYAHATAGVKVDLGNTSQQNTVGAGLDTLRNFDNIIGSNFNDTFTATAAANAFNGGNGLDTVSYAGSAAGVRVVLTEASGVGGDANGDTYTSIENVIGSANDDTIGGNAGNNVLIGGGGNDIVTYEAATKGVTVNLGVTTAQNTVGAGTDTLSGFSGVIGSDFNDTFLGNSAANSFDGGIGSDTVSYATSKAGVSVSLDGGTIAGGDADGDTLTNIENITGSAAADTIEGNADDNVLIGGAGIDTLSFASASNGITVNLAQTTAQNTGYGTDVISGFENVVGSIHADVIEGDKGNNVLDGGGDIDTVSYAHATAGVTVDLSKTTAQNTVGAGVDTLTGFENLTGSNLNDTLSGDVNDNVLDGGAGTSDTLTYADAAAGVTVSLAVAGPQATGGAGTDTISNFENLTGSGFDDVLEGDDGANILVGGAGVDTVSYAHAGAGVTINLALTTAQNTLGAGTDRLSGFENVTGSDFDDTIQGDKNNNVLDGGAGSGDTVSYAASTAAVTVSLANGAATGFGADTLSNFENVTGSNFNDTIEGDGNDNVLAGGAGVDTLSYANAAAGVTISLAATAAQATGGAGTDTISGFENLAGSAHDDSLIGSSAANQLSGGAGSDRLDGGLGADVLTGGADADTYVYADGYGADTITDFSQADGDKIDVSGVTGIFTFADVLSKATQSGANTVITFAAGNTLTLIGVTKGDLSAADFVFPQSIDGTAGDDNGTANPAINGTASSDIINGLAGNDIIAGLGGNDFIDGGAGRDIATYTDAISGLTINMAQGTVSGGGVGTDTLRGIEYIRGSEFADTYIATGFDRNSPNNAQDFELQTTLNNGFEGGGGNDTITGNGATQVFYTHAAAGVTVDLLAGTAKSTNGDDAGIGVDKFTMVGGVATVTGVGGSAFDDTLLGTNNGTYVDVFTGGAGNDLIDGRGGFDVALYYSFLDTGSVTGAINVNLAAGIVTGDASVGTDTLKSIEIIRGTKFNDTYDATGFGASSANAGSAGTFNSFEGMDGDDVVIGNGGTRIDYNFALASVTVDIQAGTGHSTNADDAAVGNDTFSGVNQARGSSYDDFLYGSTSNDSFFGGAGDDLLDGRGGVDTVLYFQVANDPITAGVTIDMASGTVTGHDASTGNDTLRSIEVVNGSQFSDVYVATGFDSTSLNAGSSGQFNQFQGLGGNDVITGNGQTRISYTNALAGVTVDLGAGTAKSTAAGDAAGIGVDTITKGTVNGIVGSNFGDTFNGSNNLAGTVEVFEGRGGNDVIDGKGGYDLALYSPDGSTTAISITATSTAFIVNGGASYGTDTLKAVESIRGTNFADTFNAKGFNGASTDFGVAATFNEFEGAAGNDIITGNGNTRVSYIGATAGVTVDLFAGTGTGNGSVGTDTFTGGVNSVRGSNFGDLLSGDNTANILDGQVGNDTLDGRGGNDTLMGGIGADTYVYKDGYGADTIVDFNRFEGDVIDLTGVSGVSSLAGIQLRATQVGANTVIAFSAGNTLTLNNVNKSDLVASDFKFGTIGTAGDDNGITLPAVQGTPGDDNVFGLAGNDLLRGFAGNDLLDGGTGRDVADYRGATSGIDVDLASGVVSGDASVGTDTLRSVEYVLGTDFADTFVATGFGPNSANDSKDIPVNSSINNGFEGGGGDDTITGNGATQAFYNFAAAAVTVDLLAGTGHSTVADNAGVGNDTFTMVGGEATVTGVAGSAFGDTLRGTNNNTYVDVFYGAGGDDFIDGRGGFDFVSYYDFLVKASVTGGITVNLAAGTVSGDASVGNDTLRSIELMRGTQYADVYNAVGFSGGSTNAGSFGTFNSFEGMGGNDSVTGNGNTRMDYNFASASVTVDIQAGTGRSTVNDDADVGNDTFTGVNTVRGSGFADFLYGSANFDTFFGGAGNDTIDGRGFFDRVQYNQSANDPVTAGITVNMSAGTVVGDASVGTDTLLSIESVQGSRFADTYNAVGFRSDSGNNKGSAGVDGSGAAFNEFQGMGGDDVITGNGNTRIAFYNALDGVTVILGNNGSSKGTAGGDIAGVGTDTLVSGVNSVVGSNFADTFTGTNNVPGTQEIFEGRGGDDLIDGRDGYDIAVYNNDAASGPITVTATSSTLVVTGVNVGTDTLTAVEFVRGTNLGDTFDATGFEGASINISYGSMTNYTEFEGMGGDDNITGNGNTRLTYLSATGAVTIDLIAGTATGNASIGNDTFSGVNSVRGSNFGDTIRGTNIVDFVDTFFGGGGNDLIDGRGGYDIAFYTDASGAITVNMAAGTVIGNPSVGTDTLRAVELIRGSNFNDVYDATGFSGASANAGSFDTFNAFEGMAGNDKITGNGNTRVDYSQAAAGVTADIGLGTGHGTAGGDVAHVGVDTFTGGVNALRGSAFNDVLNGSSNVSGFENFTGEAGNDLIDGKGGLDRAMYSSIANDNVTSGITVDMAAGTVTGDVSVGTDTLRSVEVIRATNHDDVYNAVGFSGSSTNAGSNNTFNEFEGMAGNDSITGNNNTRIAFYAAEAGVTVDLVGGTAHGTDGGDVAHVGTDTFTGVNAVRGSAFADIITGRTGSNVTLDGQAGDDRLIAGGGINTLIGGDGNDTFVFNTTKALNAVVNDFVGNGAGAGDHFEFNGFGTAAAGATFTFVSTSGGDSIWQIHSGLDGHNETITLKGITSAAGVHASDYLFV